jgi:hypothetical protein
MKHDYNVIMSKTYRCPVCFASKFVWNTDDFEMQKTVTRLYGDVTLSESIRIECFTCGFNFSVEI